MAVNLSVIKLAVRSVSVSAFISIAPLSKARSISALFVLSSSQAFPFIFSSPKIRKVAIERSSFFKFLCGVVSFSSRNITNSTFISEYFEENLEELECSHCTFSNCHNPQFYGGAVSLLVASTFKQCVFFNCTALYGGAISTDHQMLIDRCTFDSLAAYEQGALNSAGDCLIEISKCTFLSMKAHSFCIFSKYKGEGHSFLGSNISHSAPEFVIGGFEIGDGKAVVKNLFEFNTTLNGGRNSGISFWEMADFLLEDSLFIWLRAVGVTSSQGSAVWIDGESSVGAMRHCAFVFCKAVSGSVVFVMASKMVVLTDCCFTGSKEESVKGIEPVETKFNTQCATYCTFYIQKFLPEIEKRSSQRGFIFAIPAALLILIVARQCFVRRRACARALHQSHPE